MKTSIKNEAIDFAIRNPNQEVCGIFYTNFKEFNFYKCNNISIDKRNTFEIDLEDFLKVERLGTPFGIFHSHINEDSSFSEADKNLSIELDLPIFCYSDYDKIFREYRPIGYKANLMQREFIWGINDCYSLVRDYYWNNFSYLIDDYNRDTDFIKNNSSIILDNFEKQGFFAPENQIDIKEHDVLLFKSMKSTYPHHFEIFVGDSRLIKHMMNRVSYKDIIGEDLFSKKYTILRFKHFGEIKNESVVYGS